MKTKFIVLLFFMLSCSMSFAQDPLIGEIKMFAGNFAPRGWAFCDGQLLPISQNTALFSILGTTYGGDGRTTFALPDFRGRVPVHKNEVNRYSSKPNTTRIKPISLGQRGGSESVELRKVTVPEKVKGDSYETYSVRKSEDKLHARDPYIGVNYIIAIHGIFPSRN